MPDLLRGEGRCCSPGAERKGHRTMRTPVETRPSVVRNIHHVKGLTVMALAGIARTLQLPARMLRPGSSCRTDTNGVVGDIHHTVSCPSAAHGRQRTLVSSEHNACASMHTRCGSSPGCGLQEPAWDMQLREGASYSPGPGCTQLKSRAPFSRAVTPQHCIVGAPGQRRGRKWRLGV